MTSETAVPNSITTNDLIIAMEITCLVSKWWQHLLRMKWPIPGQTPENQR